MVGAELSPATLSVRRLDRMAEGSTETGDSDGECLTKP